MNSTKKAIEKIVDNLDLTIYVQRVSDNVLTSDNTLYLLPNHKVKDLSGNIFTVSSMVVNGEINLTADNGTDIFIGNKLFMFGVSTPTFLIGYPKSANSEFLDISKRTRDKVPLIWLLLGYTEDYGARDSATINVPNTTIFFLTDTDEPRWLTEQHFDIAIDRMNNLVDRFLSYFDKRFDAMYNGSSKKPLPRFGVYVRNGAEERVIDEYLSGVELKLDLELNKCEC